MKWDTAFKPRGLPDKISEALTIKFTELEREGASLFMLTLMFGYLPGLKKGVEFCGVEQRVEVLWSGLMSRLFNNPRGSFGACFFDIGRENGANMGLHAHVLMALDERRFKGKFRDGFQAFWANEESRWINRPPKPGRPTRDTIVRSNLTKFDGSESCIRYCSKSLDHGGKSGLGLLPVLYLSG